MEANSIFSVAIGGGIGASLRYMLSLYAKNQFNMTFWATFAINIFGCLFLGIITNSFINNPNLVNHNIYLLLATGIAGGFTTFSTFCWENITLLKEGKFLTSSIYIIASLSIGLLAIFAGYSISNIFFN